jgi:hypothetical protein
VRGHTGVYATCVACEFRLSRKDAKWQRADSRTARLCVSLCPMTASRTEPRQVLRMFQPTKMRAAREQTDCFLDREPLPSPVLSVAPRPTPSTQHEEQDLSKQIGSSTQDVCQSTPTLSPRNDPVSAPGRQRPRGSENAAAARRQMRFLF